MERKTDISGADVKSDDNFNFLHPKYFSSQFLGTKRLFSFVDNKMGILINMYQETESRKSNSQSNWIDQEPLKHFELDKYSITYLFLILLQYD